MQRLRPITPVAPNPGDDDRPSVVELRVHGVSGTPPEELLDTYVIDRVRGDDVAGFFRPRQAVPGATIDLEAYSWGGLTSRSWTRALWVLLAPFALINVAGWMLPPAPTRGQRQWPHALAHAVVRLLALHMTIMVTMWIGQVWVEFIGFQYGGLDPELQSVRWLRTVMGDWATDAPGRRIAAGSLVPVVAAVGLWRLGRASNTRYESFGGNGSPVGSDSFADPTFWRRPRHLRRLARTHLAGAMAVMAYLVAASATWTQQFVPAAPPEVLSTTRWIALGLLGLAALGVATARPVDDPGGWRGRLAYGLPIAAGLVQALAMAAAWNWPGADAPTAGTGGLRLDPYAEAGNVAGGIALALGAVLLVASLLHPGRRSRIEAPLRGGDIDVGFRGMGAAATSLLAYLVAGLVLLGMATWSTRLLGGRPLVNSPESFEAAAVTTIWGLFALSVVAALVSWWRATRSGGDHARLDRRRLGESDADHQSGSRRAWVASVRRTEQVRRLVDRLDLGLLVIMGAGIAMIVPILVSPFVDGWDMDRAILDWTWDGLDVSAAWLISVGLPVGLFLLIRQSFNSTRTRRLVGILWDVLTFWPRWYHPFAPPNYSARAVPELQTRLDVLTQEGHSVILSAHSQGSVLALAAIDGFRPGSATRHTRIDPATAWQRIALLTYGSPITRLYVRFFPAHMVWPIKRVAARLCDRGPGRWANLYRATDPIGGAIGGEDPHLASLCAGPPDVLAPEVANPLSDPLGVPQAFGEPQASAAEDDHVPVFPAPGDAYPAPDGHSGYDRDPAFHTCLDLLATATAGTGTGAGADG